jgi:DNA-binding HxlR family transcriptional regulator
MTDAIRAGRNESDACPGAACFELLGRKWTAYLVWALIERPRRFGELRDLTPGLTDRMLTVRLRSLEAAGIVTRQQYPEIPVRVEYTLTDRGRDLAPVILEMERWGQRWGGPHPLARAADRAAAPGG